MQPETIDHEEAERIAAIAKRAEEKAAARVKAKDQDSRVKFLTKEERQALALERLEQKRKQMADAREAAEVARRSFNEQKKVKEKPRERRVKEKVPVRTNEEKALEQLKNQYLGKTEKKKKVVKASEKFSKVYRFDWDASEDTSTELNPLYRDRQEANLLFGRGYRAGMDLRDQRRKNTFLDQLATKRQAEEQHNDDPLVAKRQKKLSELREQESKLVDALASREKKSIGTHWSDKAVEEMTRRDWRIFREDFDIMIKGGRAVDPIRDWKEAALPTPILQAVQDMAFTRPSPIQMQGIPIGLKGRDLIGIAETGSGKTAAFVIPLIAYILALPEAMRQDTPEQGPLAIVMAPTRELALQIEQEAIKLCKYASLKTLSVVGGQSIEDQAFKLREGIDIIIGTPGRLMDCLENRYLVLNQCNYVVLDEADRMIDMGFEPQVISVLDSMGGLLKSQDEDEIERQVQERHRYRVTAMFSATMPVQVERLARTYLRQPVIVKIGDEESGKNKRIEQRVMFIHPAKKSSKLIEILREAKSDKVIVFVNLKKNCDGIARNIRSNGFRPTVLHGGKSQDQRQESLNGFREGKFNCLVATDVAGRGLDIPDVTHVVNYDVPVKIENYCHRIGRTGRAGKEGVAISLLTDEDTEVMYDLKQYLIATEAEIPPQLSNHPMAKAAFGVRDERGHLVAKAKRDTVIYNN